MLRQYIKNNSAIQKHIKHLEYFAYLGDLHSPFCILRINVMFFLFRLGMGEELILNQNVNAIQFNVI